MTKFGTLSRLLLIAFACIALPAQAAKEMWPGVKYDPNIPTVKTVLGYDSGERITEHSDMLRYFDALQAAAPDRIKVMEYARSWEGRQLIYVAVGNAENVASLEDFASDMQALADPRKTNGQKASEIMSRIPASVWLEYGVHGNEISSTDAAMMTAYHLLAAPQDPINEKILANTLVFIDPLQNPDGRTRFTTRYYATVGLEHSADRQSAEHNEPWPRGRTNHYLFDMNRDWLPITQPETKGRIKLLNKYRPLVVVDLHEMGGDESYYFAPAARPFNPHMTQTQIANMNAIGRNHAKHFDAFGFDYFTREVYDAFYPGYGDSWPTFYGASASTYEVGSARGEVYKKNTGEIYTFWDSVQLQFVASISTAEGASITREKLLKDFYEYQSAAINEGKKDKKSRFYIVADKTDRAGSHKLATLMAEHGVDVFRAKRGFKACGTNYPEGAYVIDTAQPRGKFVTTTFAKQVDMAQDFIQEQERRRARNLNDQIYDVTGWALPLMYNVNTSTCGKTFKFDSEPVGANDTLKSDITNPDATVAFIVPWGDAASVRFLTAALRKGLTVKSADEAFVLDGKKTFPAGSLIIERRRNADDWSEQVKSIAAQTGAVVTGTNTSWVTDGPSFGSGRTVTLMPPKIAMAWDMPTRSLSAGNSRFVIERQLGYPVTAIRTRHLAYADLSDYHVLILPEGSYAGTLGNAGAENIRSWVNKGGVLVTLGNATRFAASEMGGLLDVKRELAYRENGSYGGNGGGSTVDGQLFGEKSDLDSAIIEPEANPDFVAGVLANVEVDQEHWLTAGVKPDVVALAYGRDIYTPIKLGSGKNLAWFKGKEELLASGYLWEENKEQLAYKPFMIYQPNGDGMVVAFTHSPTVRAYLDGLNVMLSNALFRAPAHTR